MEYIAAVIEFAMRRDIIAFTAIILAIIVMAIRGHFKVE